MFSNIVKNEIIKDAIITTQYFGKTYPTIRTLTSRMEAIIINRLINESIKFLYSFLV